MKLGMGNLLDTHTNKTPENRDVFEVFVNNTNLTFLSFVYKISIEVS